MLLTIYAFRVSQDNTTNTFPEIHLVKKQDIFVAVIFPLELQTKGFRLFQLKSDKEADKWRGILGKSLSDIYSAIGAKLWDRSLLQRLVDVARANPDWTSAHIVAKLSLVECFSSDIIAR